MGNDIDDTTDQTPRDENAGNDTPGKSGGRRLRFWLRAAEALIARERASGGRGVRERIEAAIPAEDLEVTLRTLEAIARELGDEHEIRALGSRGRGSHPRHGFGRGGFGPGFGPGFDPDFGPGLGSRGFGRGGFEGDEFESRGFGRGGFGRRGFDRGGFGARHHHHAARRGFGPHGSDRGGRHHAC